MSVIVLGIVLNLRSQVINSRPQQAEIICIPMVQPTNVIMISSTSTLRRTNLPVAISLSGDYQCVAVQNEYHEPNQCITVPIDSILAEIL